MQFLPPWRKGDARSPPGRLILKWVKRERKAVPLNPPGILRRAELSMGRITNSQTRRHAVKQAYGDYWLGPKWTKGNTRASARDWTACRTDPECASKVPRRIMRPFAQRQMKLRNGVKAQSLSSSSLEEQVSTGCGWAVGLSQKQRPFGKRRDRLTETRETWKVEVSIGVHTSWTR